MFENTEIARWMILVLGSIGAAYTVFLAYKAFRKPERREIQRRRAERRKMPRGNSERRSAERRK